MQFKNKKITIIGGGNLGVSIAQGLLNSELVPASHIRITRRRIELLQDLSAKGIQVMADNVAATQDSDMVILCVKPYQVGAVLKEILPALQSSKAILVSVATGVSLSDMAEVSGTEVPLFRAMPNTAIAVMQSMTCVATDNGSEAQTQMVLALFDQMGETILIRENLMESATVLAACGIAFALRFIRANMQGGIQIGFDAKTAELIATQTVKGASELLIREGNHPEREIDKVTTPMGCTIAGLNEMEHQGFSSSLIKGITASYDKIFSP